MEVELKTTILILAWCSTTFLGGSAYAQDSDGRCPDNWGDYIGEIERISSELSIERSVFFMDSNGNPYDCLNLEIEKDVMRLAKDFFGGMPIDNTEQADIESSLWLMNVCYVSELYGLRATHYVVHLPLDLGILNQEVCLKRISTDIEFLLESDQ